MNLHITYIRRRFNNLKDVSLNQSNGRRQLANETKPTYNVSHSGGLSHNTN